MIIIEKPNPVLKVTDVDKISKVDDKLEKGDKDEKHIRRIEDYKNNSGQNQSKPNKNTKENPKEEKSNVDTYERSMNLDEIINKNKISEQTNGYINNDRYGTYGRDGKMHYTR